MNKLCTFGLVLLMTFVSMNLAKRPDKPHPNDPPLAPDAWLDLNEDGFIDIYDLEVYVEAWGRAVEGTDWRGDYGS